MESNLSIKQKIAHTSGMPADVIMKLPILTVTGNEEISLENYSGIIEYTDSLIRIRTKTGQIIIKGKHIHIEHYTNDDMKILGRIDSIEFKH